MSASDKTPGQDVGQPVIDEHGREQQELDRELEGTFPASDPPAITRPRGHNLKSATDARARALADKAGGADWSRRASATSSPPAPRPPGRPRSTKR